MDKLTRIAIHAGCLCYAKNAGSRLSKWRLCPVHTSFNVPSSESKASEQSDLIDNDSRSSLESFDSRFTRLTPPPFEHVITEQERDCGSYQWARAADGFILGDEEIKIKDWRIRRDSKGALHRAAAKLDQLEHDDSSPKLPELFDSCIITEGNNVKIPTGSCQAEPQAFATDRQPKSSPWCRSYDREPSYRKKVRKWLLEIESSHIWFDSYLDYIFAPKDIVILLLMFWRTTLSLRVVLV
ncbi:hypothetical protein EV361DRAFT_884126 [Lentinula raphanica]|nr:hypothetical protein EV361DRAFT_884126 [Lentinula raphanica]